MSRHALVILSPLTLSLLLPTPTPAAPTFYGPTPYLSASDSPLPSPTIETFEDGLLNLPGVSASSGNVVSPGPLTDSVDADNSPIDGSGTAGHSLLTTQGSITFTFDPLALGGYPTHAGVVWTDVGNNNPTFGFANVTFEAFAPNGTSLGTLGPFTLGDGAISGATPEDRFFGLFNPDGISAITISTPTSNDWEVDHLQYAIPEPTSLLAACGLALLPLARRRHHPK